MSKKKYKKGIESLQKQIDLHRDVKLQTAIDDGNLELAGYYEKEIKRLESQLAEKGEKLLTRDERVKMRKESCKNP